MKQKKHKMEKNFVAEIKKNFLHKKHKKKGKRN